MRSVDHDPSWEGHAYFEEGATQGRGRGRGRAGFSEEHCNSLAGQLDGDGTDEADWREFDRAVLCNCNTRAAEMCSYSPNNRSSRREWEI